MEQGHSSREPAQGTVQCGAAGSQMDGPQVPEKDTQATRSWYSHCSRVSAPAAPKLVLPPPQSHVLGQLCWGQHPSPPSLGPKAECSHLPDILSYIHEMRLERGMLFKAPNSRAGAFSPECPGS